MADFNNDGNPDILWQHRQTGEVSLWFMTGATHTGGQSPGSVADLNWQIIVVGDFGW